MSNQLLSSRCQVLLKKGRVSIGNLYYELYAGGDERTSHDALLPTILSLLVRHVAIHSGMDAVRVNSRCERPFDLSKLIYVHCIDLGTQKFTTVTSFYCLEICCVLGHLSFPRELAVRRLCCVFWSDHCT